MVWKQTWEHKHSLYPTARKGIHHLPCKYSRTPKSADLIHNTCILICRLDCTCCCFTISSLVLKTGASSTSIPSAICLTLSRSSVLYLQQGGKNSILCYVLRRRTVASTKPPHLIFYFISTSFVCVNIEMYVNFIRYLIFF